MSPGYVRELALADCPVPMDLVWMVMTRCCCCGCILYFMCGFGVALEDKRSHLGGSADMSSLVCIGGIRVGYCGTHIVFWCIPLTIHWGLFIRCSLVVILPSVGGWVQIPACTFIIVI